MQLTRLGPYEIGKPLGKGGMGSVYEARNVETGDRVAVKALTPQLAMAEGFRERFEAEIESLKVLRHEGIVRLYGYGEQDGILFYSMELVDGVSLEDELRAGRRFNWREVTNIAIQMSLALKHAHDHGIVHRDIKPANILLYGDEKVKLADFGIARLFGMNQLTTAGGVLGTADYMSPEQADGRPVTARCDQYSLGGVMYALLAGRPPFHAKHLPQMLQLQRFAEPEPVRRYAPDAPEQLERVIGQLLAKDPANRFPNMQVLARHLLAMVKALSRPTADDFALPGEGPGGDRTDAHWDPAISVEVTRAEPRAMRRPRDTPAVAGNGAAAGKTGDEPAAGVSAQQEAATLAAEEAVGGVRGSKEGPAVAKPQAATIAAPVDRPARFTTVEEDEARRQALQQRSWLALVGQLAALGVVIACLGGVAFYLSRPPSADELYRAVTSRADRNSPDSLLNVEDKVSKFLALYAADPRSGEMREIQERIELDKLDRKLRRINGGGDPSLLPVEQMYLRAMKAAEESPAAAVAMLESLVALHPAVAPVDGANGVDDAAARTASIIQLAQRQLTALGDELARRTKQERAALAERMEAAERLSATAPREAAAMYRAIMELFADSPWAADMVAEARARLSKLERQP